jgi:ferredoxin-NADP reductase
MLNSSLSLWLGITFVVVGGINVWLILQASARVRDAKASTRLIAAHRIGGYLFIVLFFVMSYFMIDRLGDTAAGIPPGSVIHVTLAMILSPLIFVKVLIARYYRTHYSLLMPVGLVIFVLSFVLIGITAGPSLAHQARIQTVSLPAIDLPPAAIDMSAAAATMEKRCSKCHNLDRIAGARKDARGWLATVNRMQALPDSGISDQDSRIIVSYLASRTASTGLPTLEVARALVDQRCGRCHSLDRVYKTAKTPPEWSATVTRMINLAAGSVNAIPSGEEQQIVAYLSATQTPDSINRKTVQTEAKVPPELSASAIRSMGLSRSDDKTIGFISLVCVGALVLLVRRPGRNPGAATLPAKPVSTGTGMSSPGGSMILRLAGISPQTADSKTLRFIVPADQKFIARPGQFLTFSFLFDGKKVLRSYSICSSPARSGYVEITPKRVSQGCVSVFLNDRAAVGMTVEARGAFGRFYFDETNHQNIVLLAAGSGITPMMAMLLYIDDLCLETKVTLLYCVRTGKDVIFQDELAGLQARLPNFQYHLLLSQPHTGWSGARGRVSREFVESTVKGIAVQNFFLCGPPPFMDACRTILIGLGAKPEHIMQESFGGSAPPTTAPAPVPDQTEALVDFMRSGKTCIVRGSQTLLEAAEEHGVHIPSSCRQGQCGTCKTKLLAGKVRMDADEGLDAESRAQGFVLTCQGHPEGDVRLDA